MLKKKVILIDDHPLYREALIAHLSPEMPFVDFLAFNSIGDFSNAGLFADQIDLFILDMRLPGLAEMQAVRFLQDQYPYVKMIVLSARDSREFADQVLSAHIHLYLSKSLSIEQIVQTIRDTLLGKKFSKRFFSETSSAVTLNEFDLTERQKEILQLLKNGLTNKAIGVELNISEATVKSHLHSIFKILGVSNRIQLLKKII